ncbi:TetR/AcrR family transcriptional regulator [Alkalihalobacillus sp. AL-G]|uniref:TetR/AcrR family transcriptional regulator n=1 Tax=Alkalihalobacillus sp. AL-G TaxID=2926399 RepID=UPI00272C5095|nr:TetR/AcrR family transcriptional regulator [Alkalihalobacillus sp. AL-G]WLD94332.1 TetR/AcrR family transcriptional regulator [Alkalihalobacillus sp. AL-G]
MMNKQEIRAKETKKSILSAAGKLFSERGYDAVSMREIAKEAKCSHTTIYIYFTNKEALLYQLAMPSLLGLKEKMENAIHHKDLSPEKKLQTVSHEFIRFCLMNRTMYKVFFNAKASRVDEENPDLEINKLRIGLFNLLSLALQECLPISSSDDRLLGYSRIYFFTLHGIVGTYHSSEESVESLMERLGTTFDDAIDVLLLGFKKKIKGSEGN